MNVSPQPVLVETCDTCRQPWATHVRSSRARANAEFGALLEAAAPHEGVQAVPAVVDLRDCVLALQAAHCGPIGPAGPAGTPGRDAR